MSTYTVYSYCKFYNVFYIILTGPDSSVGRGPGFDPGPRHTKVVKNGTSCSSLGTQTYEVELGLVDPVSG